MKDIAELGERYDVHLRTAFRSRANSENAIVKEAGTSHEVIVMGVNQRPGDEPFFGNAANAILKNWRGPVLFIAS